MRPLQEAHKRESNRPDLYSMLQICHVFSKYCTMSVGEHSMHKNSVDIPLMGGYGTVVVIQC